MPSTRSASPPAFPDAGPPSDSLELSREFVEDRYRVARILHDAREEVIRFQHRWPHELQTQDGLLDALITHLRRFIPQMNRTGLVMLNECVLSNNLNNTTLDNGVWFTYDPDLIFPPQTRAENAAEVVVIDDDDDEAQDQPATKAEVNAFLAEIHPSSSAPALPAEEEAQDAESPADPDHVRPSAKALGKRPYIPEDDEDEDGADSPPPSPLKRQRHERSWSPSPSPGLSQSMSNESSPVRAVSPSAAAAAPAPGHSGSRSPSPRSSPARSSPSSPRAAGSSTRRSRSRSGSPPGVRIIADHVRQPSRSPEGLPREVSIMAVDIGNGGLEIFERREAQWRLAEYNARQAEASASASAPVVAPAPTPATAPAPAHMPPPPSAATPVVAVAPPPPAAPVPAASSAPAAPTALAAPVPIPVLQPPAAGPAVPAPINGAAHLTQNTDPADRIRLTRDHDYTSITYFRRGRAPLSREEALVAERRMLDRQLAARRLREEQQAAAAAAAATATAAAAASSAAAVAAPPPASAPAPATSATTTTTAAGPSRTPKRSPKRRRASQESADAAEREEAAASAEEERPAKRRSPSPPVASPSNISAGRRGRKSDDPKDKGKQPVRRSTRNKGASK